MQPMQRWKQDACLKLLSSGMNFALSTVILVRSRTSHIAKIMVRKYFFLFYFVIGNGLKPKNFLCCDKKKLNLIFVNGFGVKIFFI